jgi:hypothetical protein
VIPNPIDDTQQKPSADNETTYPKLDQPIPTPSDYLASFMLQPFMCNDDFIVALQLALDTTRFPIPEHHVPFGVTAAYPFSIWRKSDLTRITRNGMPSEALLAVLSEVVCVVEQDLIIQRLRSEDLFYRSCQREMEVR